MSHLGRSPSWPQDDPRRPLGKPPYADEWMEHPEQRVSGLAIASLVLGILCCIPGVGTIGAVLGVGSIVSINRSNGRLTGTGFAAVGIILGLLSTTVWIGSAMAFRWVINATTHRYAIPLREFGESLQQKDFAQARTFLTPTSQVSDEQLKAFAEQIQSELGAFKGLPQDFSPWQGFDQRTQSQQQGLKLETKGGGFPFILPIPLEFEHGSALIVPIMPSEQFMNDWLWSNASIAGNVKNIVVIKPDGTEIWLDPPAEKTETPSKPDPSGSGPSSEPVEKPQPPR